MINYGYSASWIKLSPHNASSLGR
ncbi:hypothetical protein CKAH01_03699 [Colletotrichum kahawae]|uniref:Uncharacterized protein n=1 Tax=Colletotrichum kahawae TaxID=34407 RepID=A0AAD9YPD7_COLKA|nr:hypothetical protein CKAH01_03699 [Colletotrichum kahawae]